MQHCAKASPCSAIKHLFWLNGQNRRFNLWKCAVSGCIWKGPGLILSVFKQIHEGLHDFWTIFGHSWSIFDHFWAIFWPYRGLHRTIFGPVWSQNRTTLGWFLGDFGPFLGRSGVTLGSLGDNFGIVLTSFGARFGGVLTPFRGLSVPFFSLCVPFLGFFAHFFCHFFVIFCEVDC